MLTYGIIFFEINPSDINIFLRKKLNDKYEDILINDELDILPIYKIKLYDYNHTIYLIDIKYNNLFDLYKNSLEKIKYKYFISKPFQNNMVHKRIKNIIIQKIFDEIILNKKLIKIMNNKINSNHIKSI
jgi:hypothetical protein